MRNLPDTLNLSDMRSIVLHFPDLLMSLDMNKKLIETCKDYRHDGISGICYVGLGGSAIAGDYAREILGHESKIPILVVRNYTLPQYVSDDWVVIATSYSGNTVETLLSLKEAVKRDSKIITVTSGGNLKDTYSSYPQLEVQKGLQPRAALPLLFSGILQLFEELIGIDHSPMGEIANDLKQASKQWGKLIPEPSEIASRFIDSIPIFIGSQYMKPVAYRAKCQINENAKAIAFSSELPELMHNEIEGYQIDKMTVPVFLGYKDEDSQIRKRYDAMMNLLEELGMNPLHLNVGGKSIIERILIMTHYLDMVSIELAELKGIDPLSVPRITQLKSKIG